MTFPHLSALRQAANRLCDSPFHALAVEMAIAHILACEEAENGFQTKVLTLLEKIMATIDQVAQDVSDESTLIDGVSTLIAGLQTQLAAALANTAIPADVQAKIDAVFAGAEANKAKLSAALAANTAIPPAVAATPPATT